MWRLILPAELAYNQQLRFLAPWPSFHHHSRSSSPPQLVPTCAHGCPCRTRSPTRTEKVMPTRWSTRSPACFLPAPSDEQTRAMARASTPLTYPAGRGQHTVRRGGGRGSTSDIHPRTKRSSLARYPGKTGCSRLEQRTVSLNSTLLQKRNSKRQTREPLLM